MKHGAKKDHRMLMCICKKYCGIILRGGGLNVHGKPVVVRGDVILWVTTCST
jgi:hypothetical protein